MPRSSVYSAEPSSPISPKSTGSRKSTASKNSWEPDSPRSPPSRPSSRSSVRSNNGAPAPSPGRVSTRKIAPDQAIRMMHHKLDRERQVGALMRKYARSTGSLGREELRGVMEQLGEGNEVTEEDVSHIMRNCDSRKRGFLNEEDLVYAITLWSEHVDFLPMLEDWMLQYDTDKSGYIDKTELAYLMEDMQGKPPTQKEIAWVMRQADPSGRERIGKWEIMRAQTAWNYRMQLKKAKSRTCVLL
eukprot:TRINITY_DN24228_c0_g1_i1.p1 TRINITY_DN24228_c0_g1~~TRINITY_DN24228_c0_g1_i1.p1  ORF type:complete len:259 (-),score=23.72 TRINITY_DN24228_c0_g1_i1:209-940(-)